MHCPVIDHGLTSLSVQTAVQKNEVKQFENKMESYLLFISRVRGLSCKIQSTWRLRALYFIVQIELTRLINSLFNDKMKYFLP